MKINFGCADIQPDGWLNIDNDPQYNTYHESLKNIEDSSADMIVAHCSVLMTVYPAIPLLFKEFLRVLKPGGTLRISNPDVMKGFRAYEENDISFFPNNEEDIDDRFSGWITWYSVVKTILLPTTLSRKLLESGFKNPELVNFKETRSEDLSICDLDARERECYFLEAVK